MYKAALFDLDGVLVDSEGVYSDFWKKTGEDFEVGVPNFEQVIKGSTLEQILNRYFPDETIRSQVATLIADHEKTMRYILFDGVLHFLQQLSKKGIPMAIVTSSNATKMNSLFVQNPGFRDFFRTVIVDKDVTNSKPDPEGYLKAAGRLGVAPEDCIVFEDSLNGVKAGIAAGAKVIALSTTNSPERLTPLTPTVFPTLADVDPDSWF